MPKYTTETLIAYVITSRNLSREQAEAKVKWFFGEIIADQLSDLNSRERIELAIHGQPPLDIQDELDGWYEADDDVDATNEEIKTELNDFLERDK